MKNQQRNNKGQFVKLTKIYHGQNLIDTFYCTGEKNVRAMCRAKSIEKYSDRTLFYAGLIMLGFFFITLFITL